LSSLPFAPGSIPWLLVNELRLAIRARTKGQRRTVVIMLTVLGLFMLVGGVPLALFLRRVPVEPTPGLLLTLDLILFAVFTLILSQTLDAAIMGFYQRGDLDLLLSSPLPPRRALTVRALGIAVTPLLWFGSLASIFVVPLVVLGQPRWLTAYLVLAVLALLASAAGMSLAIALFGLIGARRTRTVGQLLAALIGAAFFLLGQARNFLPDHGRAWFESTLRWADSGVFAPGAPLSWPARALLGDPLPLAAFAGGSALVFWGAVTGLGRRFASNASIAAGVASGRAKTSNRAASAQGFQGGLSATLMRKELRLLVRDPTLLSQVLLRVLYVLPLGFGLVRAGAHGRQSADLIGVGQIWALAAAVTFVAGQLAGSLAWIVICAEDAPELLACAPVDGGQVRRAKLAAAMIPVAVILSPLLIAVTWFSPWAGLCAAAGAAASSVSSGFLNLWFEKPATRKAFRGRRTGAMITGVAEVLSGLGWGATTAAAAAGSIWAIIPALVTAALLLFFRTIAKPMRGY
jgi:ABC-2 type transport system permease protein